jgi:hypothetical protein
MQCGFSDEKAVVERLLASRYLLVKDATFASSGDEEAGGGGSVQKRLYVFCSADLEDEVEAAWEQFAR